MLNGLGKLNKAVSALLKSFGIKRAFADEEFVYYYPDKDANREDRKKLPAISFSIVESDFDTFILQFVEEQFNYTCINAFMLSLLHEVGHHKTFQDISQEESTYCDDMKVIINNKIEALDNPNFEDLKPLRVEYLLLPDEYKATEWAVNYIKENEKQVVEMWNKIENALFDFYAKNLDNLTN